MNRVLVVVDVQKDFVDGSLGTEEAVSIVPNVIREINSGRYDQIYVTMDTHDENYLTTLEGRNLPVEHCIRNTAGWMIDEKVKNVLDHKKVVTIEKPTFGSFGLVQEISACMPDEITLVGLCTDICVISNALMLRAAFYQTEIRVIADACAGVTAAKHEAALEVMRSCQIQIV